MLPGGVFHQLNPNVREEEKILQNIEFQLRLYLLK